VRTAQATQAIGHQPDGNIAPAGQITGGRTNTGSGTLRPLGRCPVRGAGQHGPGEAG